MVSQPRLPDSDSSPRSLPPASSLFLSTLGSHHILHVFIGYPYECIVTARVFLFFSHQTSMPAVCVRVRMPAHVNRGEGRCSILKTGTFPPQQKSSRKRFNENCQVTIIAHTYWPLIMCQVLFQELPPDVLTSFFRLRILRH